MLPPEIIRQIAAFLVKDEAPSNRLLHLTAFCGVCVRWRAAGREVAAPIAFDGVEANAGGAASPKATLARFRKADVAHKRATFLGASRLLTGYAEVTLAGEAVSDEVLRNIAAANAGHLVSLKLLGTHAVSDAGLVALLRASPRLKQFSLEDAGAGVAGAFLPVILQCCRQLEALHIEGADAVRWADLRRSGAWWPIAPAPAPAEAEAGEQQQQQQLAHPAQQQAEAAQQQPQQQHALTAAAPGADVSLAAGAAAQAPAAAAAAPAAAAPAGASSSGQAAAGGAGPSSRRPAAAAPSAGSPQHVHSSHHKHSRRLSSSSSNGSSLDGSDDGGSSIGAASDSTSISVPAAATAALAVQLQGSSLNDEQQPGGDGGAGSSADARRVPAALQAQAMLQQQHAQLLPAEQEQQPAPGAPPLPPPQQQPPQPGEAGASPPQPQPPQPQALPPHTALRRLHVRFANTDSLQHLIERVPGLTELQLDGPAYNIQCAALHCPGVRRLAFLVSSPMELDAALFYLNGMPGLRGLELEVKGMMLSTEQLRVLGMLPLRELALDSHAYRQHPSMPRPQYSHLDNEGVKGLVDSICQRMRSELMPLKLSLCGATALKQEAVSALLRLPILAAIDTGGCVKLTPMDRMRLVAKVKAGQGMLEGRGGAGGLAALRLPHVL